MKPLSKNKQITNCLVALMRWKKVKPAAVELSDWRCGTQACFGGHLATWDEFKAQGVRADPDDHSPVIDTPHFTCDSLGVANHLFGDDTMFCARGYGYSFENDGDRSVSDHEIVVRRLEAQIVRLSQ